MISMVIKWYLNGDFWGKSNFTWFLNTLKMYSYDDVMVIYMMTKWRQTGI